MTFDSVYRITIIHIFGLDDESLCTWVDTNNSKDDAIRSHEANLANADAAVEMGVHGVIAIWSSAQGIRIDGCTKAHSLLKFILHKVQFLDYHNKLKKFALPHLCSL